MCSKRYLSIHHRGPIYGAGKIENKRKENIIKIVQDKIDYRVFYLYKLAQKEFREHLPLEIIKEINIYLMKMEYNYYGVENRLPIKSLEEIFPSHKIEEMKNKRDIVETGVSKVKRIVSGVKERHYILYRGVDNYAYIYYDNLGNHITLNYEVMWININSRLYVNKAWFNRIKLEIETIKKIFVNI